MPKKFLTFSILFIVLAGVLAPGVVLAADCSATAIGPCTQGGKQCNKEQIGDGQTLVSCPTDPSNPRSPETTSVNGVTVAGGGGLWEEIATGVAMLLMRLSSFVLIISGWIFDWIVDFSIIKMATNIGDKEGVGGAITLAWATLRDIANMCFIFVLLYAAFKTMFDSNFGNFQTTIKNIIIVALLINFSLFFSKVVIDASNIVAIGFYKSIISSSAKLDPNTGAIASGATFDKTISAGYMNMLRLQTFFSAKVLEGDLKGGSILTMGIMSSIFMLITAVILLIAGIMFAARFIILIFLMILSPLALIAFAIPGQSKHFDDWFDALKNQSFFAPLYFALTWVVFKLGMSLLAVLDKTNSANGITTTGAEWSQMLTQPKTVMALIVNYVLIIGFSIAALIFAKQMASSGALMSKHFDKITGAMGANKVAGVVGGVALGGAAALGRRTIGAGASRLARDTRFQQLAGKYWLGQKALEGTEKVAKSSFDVRQTKNVGSALQKTPLGSFGAGKTGGFEKYKEDKTKNMVDTGKKFTDKDAKEAYAKRIASKWYAKGGSVKGAPGYGKTIAGTMGRSNRLAAATLIDDRIKEIQQEINTARGEVNSYRGAMGLTGGAAPTAADLANLSSYEQGRYFLLTGTAPPAGFVLATPATGKSISDLSTDLAGLKTDKTTLGLDNTQKQQY